MAHPSELGLPIIHFASQLKRGFRWTVGLENCQLPREVFEDHGQFASFMVMHKASEHLVDRMLTAAGQLITGCLWNETWCISYSIHTELHKE